MTSARFEKFPLPFLVCIFIHPKIHVLQYKGERQRLGCVKKKLRCQTKRGKMRSFDSPNKARNCTSIISILYAFSLNLLPSPSPSLRTLCMLGPRPLRDVDGPQPEFAKDKTTGWVKLMTCSCWLLNFVQIQCWPWQILSLQNLVLEKVASTI